MLKEGEKVVHKIVVAFLFMLSFLFFFLWRAGIQVSPGQR
jgi:hypothetical protein